MLETLGEFSPQSTATYWVCARRERRAKRDTSFMTWETGQMIPLPTEVKNTAHGALRRGSHMLGFGSLQDVQVGMSFQQITHKL